MSRGASSATSHWVLAGSALVVRAGSKLKRVLRLASGSVALHAPPVRVAPSARLGHANKKFCAMRLSPKREADGINAWVQLNTDDGK